MAIEDVTKEYVDTITNGKYGSRTSQTSDFERRKSIYSVYLNPNTSFMPDKKYTHGLALLVAHSYAIDDTKTPDSGGSDAMTGSVTSESVGDVSIGYGSQPSFESQSGFKAWLGLSKYGNEFLYLMETFKPTPIVI